MQQTMKNATVGANADGRERTPREPSTMLSVQDVADMLRCSTRTVYRLADSGRMPRPVKLGALVRWRRAEIEEWVADRCGDCRKAVRQ